MKKILLVFLSFCLLTACQSDTKIAIVDVQRILQNGVHAQEVAKFTQEAQAIFQYNLDVIVKKLETYKNKEQAQYYLIEAKKQLEAQLERIKQNALQAMLNTLNEAINEEKINYSIILNKSELLYAVDSLEITEKVQNRYNSLLVQLPSLPLKIDEPNLPEDKEQE